MNTDLRKLVRELRRHQNVELVNGKGTHIKVFVDGRLTTILSDSHGGNDLKASKRALRHAGVGLPLS